MQRWLAVIVAFVVAGCATVTPADAQSPAGEPPLIAGRVAVADGDAQIWRAEEDSAAGQWDDAVVNDVVSAGTGLYTGGDGRNEVRVGPHTFRLGANSRGGFTQLDYSTALFNLEYGTLNVRLARPEHGETTSVTVAGLRIDLVAPGRYRIDATDQGPMRLTVFEGHGTVRSASQRDRRQQRPGGRRQSGRRRLQLRAADRVGVRPMGAGTRRAVPAGALGAVRVAVHDRLRGTRHLRRLVVRRKLRRGVVPARRPGGLGAVPVRTVALDPAVGLDLGGLRAVGLCAVPLRTLGDGRPALGLGAGRLRAPAGVGSRAGGLRRHRRQRLRGHRRAGGRLVSARAVAPLRAALSPQPALHDDHQPDDHQPAAARRAARSHAGPGDDHGAGTALPRADPPRGHAGAAEAAGTEADRAAAAERRAGTAVADAEVLGQRRPSGHAEVADGASVAAAGAVARPAAARLAADARDAADGRRPDARSRRDAATAAARQRPGAARASRPD